MGKLDGDTHVFQDVHHFPSQVLRDVERSEVEVAAGIERCGILDVLEQKELHLGMDVEGKAELTGLFEISPQHVARVAPKRPPVGGVDVAKDAGYAAVGAPFLDGHDLKCAGVGARQHVRFLNSGEAFDRRPIEPDALVNRLFELLRGYCEALQKAEHVGKPQPYQPNAPLFDGPKDILLLRLHRVSSLRPVCFEQVTEKSTAAQNGCYLSLI